MMLKLPLTSTNATNLDYSTTNYTGIGIFIITLLLAAIGIMWMIMLLVQKIKEYRKKVKKRKKNGRKQRLPE